MSMSLETRIRNVTAVLGPTNTGKTHLAIERMLGHESGPVSYTHLTLPTTPYV